MSGARTGAPDSALDAPDDGVVVVGADVGAHADELVDVAEPAREDVLGDDADAVGDGQHGDEQRLVVGGDARVRQRGDVDRPQPAGRHRPQPVGVGRDAHAHLAELLR